MYTWEAPDYEPRGEADTLGEAIAQAVEASLRPDCRHLPIVIRGDMYAAEAIVINGVVFTPRAVSLERAAILLGLRPVTLRAHIKAGVITATKHGRDWLITEAEVARFAQERAAPGRPKKS